MSEAIVGVRSIVKPSLYASNHLNVNFSCPTSLRQCSSSGLFGNAQRIEGIRNGKGGCLSKVKAFPADLPLMAVLVESIEGQIDYIVHKSIWHLSDIQIKNVYIAYIMFTCWGCLFFGSMKDPFYDSEHYRKDGGDGTGHWVYDKQEDIEENARAELWKEELLEEIEQKVGGLKELEEVATK